MGMSDGGWINVSNMIGVCDQVWRDWSCDSEFAWIQHGFPIGWHGSSVFNVCAWIRACISIQVRSQWRGQLSDCWQHERRVYAATTRDIRYVCTRATQYTSFLELCHVRIDEQVKWKEGGFIGPFFSDIPRIVSEKTKDMATNHKKRAMKTTTITTRTTWRHRAILKTMRLW